MPWHEMGHGSLSGTTNVFGTLVFSFTYGKGRDDGWGYGWSFGWGRRWGWGWGPAVYRRLGLRSRLMKIEVTDLLVDRESGDKCLE